MEERGSDQLRGKPIAFLRSPLVHCGGFWWTTPGLQCGEKRGGRCKKKHPRTQPCLSPNSNSVDLMALDEARTRLGRLMRRQSQHRGVKFFGGLTFDEIAPGLNVSLEPWNASGRWRAAGCIRKVSGISHGHSPDSVQDASRRSANASFDVPKRSVPKFLRAHRTDEDLVQKSKVVHRIRAVSKDFCRAGPCAAASAPRASLIVGRLSRIIRWSEENWQGRHGVVYRGADTHSDRDIALKRLLPPARNRPRRRRRFVQEGGGSSLKTIHYIVTIHDINTTLTAHLPSRWRCGRKAAGATHHK